MRRSNLLTLRKFFNWKSSWCSKFFYRSLLYKDLFVQFYLSSLFFKLRFNTSSIKLNYISTNIIICTFDIYINSLRRLKRYNNIFLIKISKMYDYMIVYLNVIKNNQIFFKKNDALINSLYNFKSFYLNFFFSIFKYKKKSKFIISKNIILNPIFLKIKFISIFYFINNLYSYNDNLKLDTIYKFLNLDDKTLDYVKFEYYYKTIKIANNYKTLFFINFDKIFNFNYNFGIFKYNYLNIKCFFFTFINYKFDILKLYIYTISNIYYYFQNWFKSSFFFNKLISNLFFKTLNFSYNFNNKFNINNIILQNNLYFFSNKLLSLVHFKKNIVFKKLNFYKIKSSFFFFINSKFVNNFKKIKSLSYFKKIKLFKLNKISKFLKKIYLRLFNLTYDRQNNYLLMFWILKKIWFSLFNRTYITYLYKIVKFRNKFKYKFVNLIIQYLSIVNKYFYLFNFNKSYKYSLNFLKHLNLLMKFKRFILVFKFDLKKIKFFFKYIYTTAYFNSLFLLVEKTLMFYNNKNTRYILIPNIFLFIKPFISSAKMICDYLYFKLKKKLTINNVYNKIRKWQLAERSAMATSFRLKKKIRYYYINYKTLKKSIFQTQLFKNNFFRESLEFRAPLRGIRCICSGPPYKAKRKLRNFYHIWVSNFSLTGWMPLQQFKYQIDYHQTFIILKRATIGLKVWILLESYVVLK